jgi:hypothetical protein
MSFRFSHPAFSNESIRAVGPRSSPLQDHRFQRSLLAAVALTITACSTCGIENEMSLVKPGMKADQVEKILGRPARIDETQTADQTLTGETYHYSTPSGEGRVVFVNGTVFKAEFLAGAKS